MPSVDDSRRPWGHYVVLADEPSHKVKRIVVDPGQRLSLQRHERRSEHWYFLSGNARVTLDGRTLDLGPGDAIDIPRRAVHRIANPGREPVVLIEVQTGEYFGEDDIERLEDDYDRA